MILADLTWQDVALSAIPTFASLGSAYIAYLIRRDVKTSNGKTIGEAVEQTHAAVADNAATLEAIAACPIIQVAAKQSEDV